MERTRVAAERAALDVARTVNETVRDEVRRLVIDRIAARNAEYYRSSDFLYALYMFFLISAIKFRDTDIT